MTGPAADRPAGTGLLEVLAEPWEIVGRVMPASNETFLAMAADGETKLVYKPIDGESPLWDFPDRTLARREYAAYLVSEASGWQVVPETVLAEGPAGEGMVQRWMEPVADVAPVDVVPPHSRGEGWCHVFDGHDGEGRSVWLVHEDSVALRRMALFDALINNGDRKGGHILPVTAQERRGVDHGVAFHVDYKLRTVLWGWAGEPFDPAEAEVIARIADDEALAAALLDLLDEAEVAAFGSRARRLLETGCFPVPAPGWPAVPWPPF